MSASVPHDWRQLIDDYYVTRAKFRKGCSQVVLLNNRIADMQVRYDRAVTGGQKAQRYVARLNMATFEGVRNMIYEWAVRKADQLDVMQDDLVALGLMEEEYTEGDVVDTEENFGINDSQGYEGVHGRERDAVDNSDEEQDHSHQEESADERISDEEVEDKTMDDHEEMDVSL